MLVTATLLTPWNTQGQKDVFLPECLSPSTSENSDCHPSAGLSVNQKIQSGCLGLWSRPATSPWAGAERCEEWQPAPVEMTVGGACNPSPDPYSPKGKLPTLQVTGWRPLCGEQLVGACLAPLGLDWVSSSFHIRKPLPRAIGWAQRLAGSIILMQSQQPCSLECEPTPKMPTSPPTDPG